MGYAYPPPKPKVTGSIQNIHYLLKSPTLLAKRVRTLAQQRFIADALLTKHFDIEGGGIVYETGESIFSGTDPSAVAPLAEYPLVNLAGGGLASAFPSKWGQGAIVSDEAVKRQKMNPVTSALGKMVNQTVKFVDTGALAVINSAVTNATPATAPWTAAGTTGIQIYSDVQMAAKNQRKLNEGFDPKVVALDEDAWTSAMIKFVASGLLPRENLNLNPVLTGDFPNVGGFTWLASPNAIPGVALLVDTDQLGGMGDEDLQSPEFTSAEGPGTAPIEVASERLSGSVEGPKDGYFLRSRRNTVAIVDEPNAGWKITGVS